MTTAVILRQRLHLIFNWYQRMVNPKSGMLEYLYIPQTDQFVRENCPIRDIASVWDTELLGEFLERQELRPIIAKSLGHFSDYVVRRGDYLILDSARLGETLYRSQRVHDAGAAARAAVPKFFRNTENQKSCRRNCRSATSGWFL